MTAQASIARRIALAVVAMSAILATASCAAGQHTATANETPAIDGTDGQIGSVQLGAVSIKAPPVSCYLPGADVALSLIIVNSGQDADTLAGVSSPRFASALVAATPADASAYTQANPGTGSCAPAPSGSPSSSTPVVPPTSSDAAPPAQSLPKPAEAQTIAPGRLLQLGVTGTGTDTSAQPVVLLSGLTGGPLYVGESIPITFTFAHAGTLTLTVPVQLSVAPNNSFLPESTDSAGE